MACCERVLLFLFLSSPRKEGRQAVLNVPLSLISEVIVSLLFLLYCLVSTYIGPRKKGVVNLYMKIYCSFQRASTETISTSA